LGAIPYKGEVVYYLLPLCSSIISNLYNADGDIICHPDRGFGGQGDGRCPISLQKGKMRRFSGRSAGLPPIFSPVSVRIYSLFGLPPIFGPHSVRIYSFFVD
jgi:hypothetical protein